MVKDVKINESKTVGQESDQLFDIKENKMFKNKFVVSTTKMLGGIFALALLATVVLVLNNLFDQHAQLIGVKRFEHVAVRAVFYRLHSGFDASVRGNDYHFRFGPGILYFFQ